MLTRPPDTRPPSARPGRAFIATLIGCCALVAFAMLKQVELTNDQAIAIAVLCGGCVLSALVGERLAQLGRIKAYKRARDRKLAKANAAAKKAADAAAQAGATPPPGTNFGNSIAADIASKSHEPDPSPLQFANLGKVGGGNHRKFGRLPLEQLCCNLGEVLDLSAGGMKVLSQERHTGAVEVELADAEGEFVVDGAIAWSKRSDSKHWEQGVEFDNLTPEQRRRLTVLATGFRKRRAMSA